MKAWEEYAKHGDLRSVIDSGDTLGFKNHYINILHHKILADNVENLQGKRILDLGCGIGRFVDFLQLSGAEVIGIDSCKEMLTLNTKCKTICAPITDLPFEDKYFDAVLSVWTLQYLDIKPLVRTIEEINRVLNFGGDVYLIEQLSNYGYDYVYPRYLSDYLCVFKEMNNFSFVSSTPIMRENDKIVGIIHRGIIPDKYFSMIIPYHLNITKHLNLHGTEYIDYFMHFKKEVI